MDGSDFNKTHQCRGGPGERTTQQQQGDLSPASAKFEMHRSGLDRRAFPPQTPPHPSSQNPSFPPVSTPRLRHHAGAQLPPAAPSPARVALTASRLPMSSRHEKEKAVNVQVLLRCRPFSEDELRSNAPQVVTCNDFQREVSVSQSIAGKQFDRVFTFDKVFGPSAQQKDLYEQAVVPIVNEVLEGFNCTIFAYGQTGTGKTYTMEGECKRSKSGSRGELPVHAGVIPRAIKQIFDTLEGQNAEYSVKVTFLELYNEEITDLLAPEEISKIAMEEKQKKALPLMEDGKGGVLVRGLEEEIVTNAGEIFTLLERGSAKRRTAETLLNKQSSRSHSLFSITIHIKEATPEGEELIKCGKLNLVDLAGSENISRSGAREGRAREAGEINKSLLTLGRVITALVEHLGHIPYRDSKLTRLLRDSLGGRTKTCIIATVSPSVHCLEETLSTLDYAHRAKNIKNRPEVNQKMMKTTLIKDLYGEIDRLKAEVYATREKNGVYIPKDRYYQEESERKAMAEQIEQMSTQLETNQKQIEEMQHKHTNQIQIAAELTKKLEATEKCLEHTSDMLASTREELKQSHYRLKEKEFIISEQRKAENALTHQACVLRSDLEKSIHENALLFSKLAREDQLSATNRGIVDNFQSSMSEKITELCNTLAASISQQNQQIKQLEELCKSHLQYQEKSFIDLKDRVSNARFLYLSHLETQRNIVHLNNASTNGFLEEVSSLASGGCTSLDQLFASSKGVADQMLADILDKLSSHRSEIAHFAQELRERFNTGKEHTQGMSNFVNTLLEKMGGASADLHSHTAQVHEVQTKAILDFRKAYEEQTRVEAQNLIAEINNLISSHLSRQKELVEDKLKGFSEAVLENKAFLDAYTATAEGEKNDAKRKWEHMAAQAESNCVDGADFSSVKHCRMELLLQQCVNTADAASTHWKDMDQSVQDFSKKHLTDVKALVSNATETNEQYNLEIDSGWSAAEEDVSKNNTDVLVHMKDILEQDHASTSEITKVLDCQGRILDKLDEDHSALARSIRKHTTNTFQKDYKDYEPKGDTPVRSEPDVPSKAIIESLRAMPMEALTEEFRENHPYVSSKEPKPSMIPRSPLLPRN